MPFGFTPAGLTYIPTSVLEDTMAYALDGDQPHNLTSLRRLLTVEEAEMIAAELERRA